MNKYCIVVIGKGSELLKDLVNVCASQNTSVGFMQSPGILIGTFISDLTKPELYLEFGDITDVTFVLTEVDEFTFRFETDEMVKKMGGIFDGFIGDTTFSKTPFHFGFTPISTINYVQEQGDKFNDNNLNLLTDGLVRLMSEKEKKEKIDEILSIGRLSDNDRYNLGILSK